MYHGERFNSISHLIGLLLAVAGASVLITLAAVQGDILKIVGSSIYGVMLVVLYGVSTLYHSIPGTKPKAILQKLDHISIYLFIAGSYTPITLVALKGSLGWWIFGIIWSLAAIGISCEFTIAKKTRIPSLIIYLLMGWLIVFAFKDLMSGMPMPGVVLLAIGGLLYTGGVYFFVLDEKYEHFHGIWHLFVMGGSVFQYFSILLYLI
ncbi:hemolysin III [Bdellovibrio sp. qaytius]|nr:hemolysin III [Bdellovibrio sp. qaytius]